MSDTMSKNLRSEKPAALGKAPETVTSDEHGIDILPTNLNFFFLMTFQLAIMMFLMTFFLV